MINVHGVATWSGGNAQRFARLGGRHRFELPVRHLDRSVRFYERVFGFKASIAPGRQSATVAVAPNAELVLDPDAELGSGQTRWSLLVTDLDAVRKEAWDLGVAPARDSGAPDQVYRDAHKWSLYLSDPDGNPLQLVEIRAGRESRDRWTGSQGAAAGTIRQAGHGRTRAASSG